MQHLGPFDPSDPFDAVAESFRRQVADIVLVADRVTLFRELDSRRQLECLMAGIVTGLIGVCFSYIKPEGRDEMIMAIERYIPQARENVEAIIDTALPLSQRGET